MQGLFRLDRRTSIRAAYDSGLTSAALELGENEVCKGFTFSCVGRVQRVECLDVALVDVLRIPISRATKKETSTTHEFAFLVARKPLKMVVFLTLLLVVVIVIQLF